MDDIQRRGSDLLDLEERQLFYFLNEVRPVGEEKSELYPEAQYFNVGFSSLAANYPDVRRKILARSGSLDGYAKLIKRVLSPATALHISGMAFSTTWGREMALLEQPSLDRSNGAVIETEIVNFSDHDAAESLVFSYDLATRYRCDGQAYPADSTALGSNYRTLPEDMAIDVARGCSPVDVTSAKDVLRLLGSVRALSFLMEAETREALMVHGPYPVDEEQQLVIFECSDLHWSLFPNFPLPGTVRWSLPQVELPCANLAIGLIVRNATVTADRFGTLYIDPLTAENVTSACIMTRGSDEFRDEGLQQIPISEARSLRKLADDIQEHMFLQIATWDLRQRMAAGAYEEQMTLLRFLSAAGYDRSEIERSQIEYFKKSESLWAPWFEKSLVTPTAEIAFNKRLECFISGKSHLFTPFAWERSDAIMNRTGK